MITKPTSVDELKDIFQEMFLAETSNVSKVSAGSAVNATSYGVAKIAQKVLKDIAIREGHIFPESAYGNLLDEIAKRDGIPDRFGASESSTHLRIMADPGTTYTAGTHSFESNEGATFDLVQDVTVGQTGIAYAKVRSSSTGSVTNVSPLTINNVIPSAPSGHQEVTNEFGATGGRDNEDDEMFRRRIEEGVNILATGTLAMVDQALMKVNNRVLRAYKGGMKNGAFRIFVASVNGMDFTQTELDQMRTEAEKFIAISTQTQGIVLENIPYFPIDISYRVVLNSGADADRVRRVSQTRVQRHFDYRFWQFGDWLRWSDVLFLIERIQGVNRVLENFFFINGNKLDVQPPDHTLPRIRSFTMYDENGNIISDSGNVLTPSFFPNQPNLVQQTTSLMSV